MWSFIWKLREGAKGILTDHHLSSSTDECKQFMEQNGLIDENKFLAFLAFVLYHPKGLCARLKFHSEDTSLLFYGSYRVESILIQLLALFSILTEMSKVSYHVKHNNIYTVSI